MIKNNPILFDFSSLPYLRSLHQYSMYIAYQWPLRDPFITAITLFPMNLFMLEIDMVINYSRTAHIFKLIIL